MLKHRDSLSLSSAQMYFEIILVSPQARGLKEGRTEVKVKMRSLVNDGACLFARNDFLDRKYRMQEMYQNYIEGETWDIEGVCTGSCDPCKCYMIM